MYTQQLQGHLSNKKETVIFFLKGFLFHYGEKKLDFFFFYKKNLKGPKQNVL